jgi:hypothetical protein
MFAAPMTLVSVLGNRNAAKPTAGDYWGREMDVARAAHEPVDVLLLGESAGSLIAAMVNAPPMRYFSRPIFVLVACRDNAIWLKL